MKSKVQCPAGAGWNRGGRAGAGSSKAVQGHSQMEDCSK